MGATSGKEAGSQADIPPHLLLGLDLSELERQAQALPSSAVKASNAALDKAAAGGEPTFPKNTTMVWNSTDP